MISHPHQCIFVHIPKTAGNSINRVFGIGWENHKNLQLYRDELPPELFRSYFKFAVVRNPWDRLLSDYNYQRKKSREKDFKLFVFTEGGSKRNFAEWVEVALAHPDYYDSQRWGGTVSPTIHRWSPQIDWISVDGAPRLDFVARLERLPEDFRQICRRLGLPGVRLPHRNRRLHWHYSHYYDRSTRDLVASYYVRDIEYFGYEFEKSIVPFRLPGSAFSSRPVKSRAGETPVHQETSVAQTERASSRRIWAQRSYAVLVAAFAMFIGAWTAPLSQKTPDPDGARSVGAAAQETFGRVLAQSANQSMGGISLNPFAQIRRLGRNTPGLHLSLELLLPASPALTPVLVMDSPTQRLPSASWPTMTPDERPAPRVRGWFTRHAQDS